MINRTPPGPPSDQRNDPTPATPPPDRSDIQISSSALHILARCAVGIFALWTVVELAKLGADPAILVPILTALRP